MKQFLKKRWVVPVGAIVLTLAIGSAAFAATGTGSSGTTSSGKSAATATQKGPFGHGEGGQRSDETPLTGDALTQAQAAALAEVGSDATVMRAETDADGNAKYEVHVKKADGTMVTVYLDESFNVVKTEEGRAGGRHGNGEMGGQRSDETALTGDTLAQAQAAALAAVGSDATVVRAETDADGNAAYEVHVKKADGTMVTVYLDESFKVVKTEEGHRGMGGRHGGDCDGELDQDQTQDRDRSRDGSGTASPSTTSTSSNIS